jgi:hypothetical protein
MKNINSNVGNFAKAKLQVKRRSLLAIIALVMVIGFSMTACGEIDVPVSEVTLNKSSISLAVGGTETLTATVSPSDATNKNVGWSSSNTGVATVTYGTVTAVAPGSATITVTTEDGGKTAQCTVTVTSSATAVNQSLDGVWKRTNGAQVTVSGSTGTLNVYGSFDNETLFQDAIKKGYYKLETPEWRNLKSSGNLTWTGEVRGVTSNNSSPNVAIGEGWTAGTFTLSADGQTLNVKGSGGGGFDQNWTRSGYTIDGVWLSKMGAQVTVSGSTGTLNVYGTFDNETLFQDAIKKGYYKLETPQWRNLKSTDNLTWTGEVRGVTSNTSSPNVATGEGWTAGTFTLSADGQTLNVKGSGGGGFDQNWTRKQ